MLAGRLLKVFPLDIFDLKIYKKITDSMADMDEVSFK
jgi:hypothetical protein